MTIKLNRCVISLFRTLVRTGLCALMCLSVEGATSGNATYTYDGLGRIVALQYEDGTGQIFVYDPAGNRKTSYTGTPAIATFASSSLTTTEPASGATGSITLTVKLSTAAVAATTYSYTTIDGSAKSGTNYTFTSGNVTLAVGASSATIAIPILHHAGFDGPVSFFVQLSPVSPNALTTNPSTANVTINDSDPAPAFAISAPSSVTQGSNVTFTVKRTNAVNFNQTINYTTVNGSASSGVSYVATSGILTFAPTDSSKTFTVSTLPISGYLGNVTFSGTISSPSVGGSLSPSTVATTINDSHTPFVLSVKQGGLPYAGQCPSFTITLSGTAPAAPVLLTYAILPDTAKLNIDYSGLYSPLSGTLEALPAGVSPSTSAYFPGKNFACQDAPFGLETLNPVGVQPGSKDYIVQITFNAGTPYSSMAPVIAHGNLQYQPDPNAPTLLPAGGYPSWKGVMEVSSLNYTLHWIAPAPPGTTAWDHYDLKDTTIGFNKVVYSGPNLSYTGKLPDTDDHSFVVRACQKSGTCTNFSQVTTVQYYEPTGGGGGSIP